MGERYYVYAIAGSAMHLPAGISGLGGPLLILPYRELGAVVSHIHSAETQYVISAAGMEDLLRHEAVVEAVCAAWPALPVRFGTVLCGDRAVRHALASQYDVLCDDLHRIGDKVELGVTALWHLAKGEPAALAPDRGASGDSDRDADAGTDARHPGLAYMRARQTAFRQEQSARERALTLGRELDAALRGCAIERRRTICPSERLALRDRYLLERERLSALETALTEVRRCHQEVRLLVSGPWPPYSFVTSPSRDAAEILQGDGRASESN